MATKVVMEALSPTMEEGRLVEWKKQPGDAVAVGDVIAEVETDKAVMELVARAGGTLLEQLVTAGSTVPVASTVAIIGEAGEKTNGTAPAAAAPAAPAPAAAAAAPAAAPAATAPVAAPAAAPNGGAGERVKASPLARRIAAERGIDLSAIAGTGPEGRIVQRDVEAAPLGAAPARPAASAPAAAAPAPAAPMARPTPRPADGSAFTDVPLSQMRKTIAKRLAQSIGPVPTFYLTAEVDMTRLKEMRAALPPEPKVTFNDIILKATALALAQHPECNAWWTDTGIRRWHEVHLGIAVAIEDGLITPVLRDADRLPLRELATRTADLVGRAKGRKLGPEEYTGSTFSVSNLGMLGIDEFTAIINPPEAGILAIGRIAEQAVVHEGAVVIRPRMRLTMSCDHRVIDGATGARFLQTLVRMLENPLAMVW